MTLVWAEVHAGVRVEGKQQCIGGELCLEETEWDHRGEVWGGVAGWLETGLELDQSGTASVPVVGKSCPTSELHLATV